jgi:hypothetical protein
MVLFPRPPPADRDEAFSSSYHHLSRVPAFIFLMTGIFPSTATVLVGFDWKETILIEPVNAMKGVSEN